MAPKGQDKLLTKKIKVNKQTKQFKVCFLELTLVGHRNMWLKMILISQYIFIAILCAKMSRVNKAFKLLLFVKTQAAILVISCSCQFTL